MPSTVPARNTPDSRASAALTSNIGAIGGVFDLTDVWQALATKIVRRHPHVFGDKSVSGAEEVLKNWEQIKKAEQGADSIVAGITPALPALLLVQKLLRKAASVGLDPVAVPTPADDAETLGAALAASVAAHFA